MTFNGSNPFHDDVFEAQFVRARLTPLDRARLLAKRKEIYERGHPATRPGGDRRSSTHRDHNADYTPRGFVEDTAALTPWSRRTISRYTRIGERLSSALQAALAETPLANRGGDLEQIANMKPEEQQELLQRLRDAEQPPPSLSALMRDPNAPPSRPKSHMDKLTGLWAKASENHRRQFLKHLRAEASDGVREEFSGWLGIQEGQS